MIKNESGRSMIEMLGVLAIIGVLSVGGLLGYTQAMRKHKVNEATQAISMMAIWATVKGDAAKGKTYVEIFGGSLPQGTSALVVDETDPKKIDITMENNDLCNDVRESINSSPAATFTPSYPCTAGKITITLNI